jgi:hypothetical protein
MRESGVSAGRSRGRRALVGSTQPVGLQAARLGGGVTRAHLSRWARGRRLKRWSIQALRGRIPNLGRLDLEEIASALADQIDYEHLRMIKARPGGSSDRSSGLVVVGFEVPLEQPCKRSGRGADR